MVTAQETVHGDFSNLAVDYAKFRPGYAEDVIDRLIEATAKPVGEIDFVDVGAGTGIWTRMVARRGLRSVRAVEPNEEMRRWGEADISVDGIVWYEGSGEDTTLPDSCCDLLSMASSFHWTDFDRSTAEFQRVLRPGGWFVAVWNPRDIERNPLLVEIEAELKRLVPNMKRVSSGRSEFCDSLTERLKACNRFSEVREIEGHHEEIMTRDRYLGVWRSVNDIRHQAGPERFERFMAYVAERVKDEPEIRAPYQTKAWAARVTG